jgi:HEAT repeats
MFSDPFRPDSPSDVEIKPTDDDVVRALVEIEKASTVPPPVDSPLTFVGNQPVAPVTRSWFRGLVMVIVFTIVAATFARRWLGFPAGQPGTGPGKSFKISSATQAEAEQLLQQLARGESGAADQVLEQSADWTGKTHRTPKADQSILIALNRPELRTREGALAAELALDGVPQSETGLNLLKEAVGDPSQRVWALWMLGALGYRGIDPVHTAKILESYLTDPDVNVRASAVNGLSLLATDETVPPMLDRFRNDPSPVVEERAACGLAQSGMYTREQRMTAAASIVGWLDDSLLTPQQRVWSIQALHDISGQDHGTDSAAWRAWYESTR